MYFQEIPGLSEALLNQGAMGICILILLGLLIWQIKRVDNRDMIIVKTSNKMTSVLSEFTVVVRNMQEETKKLPEEVKDKIDPKLDHILRNTEDLKTKRR